MAFKDRLKEARNRINLSKEDFAEIIGVSVSAIGNYEAGASFPKTEILYKIFDALDTSPNFLFQDVATKTKEDLSIYELEIIKKYRSLDLYGKEAVESILKIEYNRVLSNTMNNASNNIIKVPLADSSLSAGTGNLLLSDSYEMIEIDGNKYPDADLAFKIKGDSMEPEYKDGDIVYIHKTSNIEVGEIGAFLYDGEQYIKQLSLENGVYMLHSLNSAYSDIIINNDIITYGKVLN